MCGLVGAYGQRLSKEPALAAIAHRGPDSAGWWTSGPVTLGHTRLAIQDADNAVAGQPYRRGTVTLTYNGELWNTAALRSDDPAPVTNSDTEQVARLLDEYGWLALDHLDGMFALAWHDETPGPRQGTWLARDRFGKVPLYACRAGQKWLWASELKALPRGIPATAVAPGTAVHLPDGKVYRWATPDNPDRVTAAGIALHLREGVRKRLVSDRPLAFLLSGGLDSTMVLAAALDLGVKDPIAYTAVYDPASPDTRAARQVARELGVHLVEVKVPQPDRQALHDAVRAVEVPMKAQVEIALGCLPLARAIASDGYRVVLSGEAADELFGGYGSMQIQASAADDEGWREIRRAQLAKMARGNFVRVNKIFMAAGVEARLPFMERGLVAMALAATKRENPPGKKLLKNAAAGLVPRWVIGRPKDTFQGAAGLNLAAAATVRNPTVFYHAEARSIFGYLPKG
jgi:asparagine synthase (glutamine-hydrolysing)